MLLVDEAHATGIFGKTGAGVVEHYELTGAALIAMGTLSKAIGSLGGYVAGSAKTIDFLRNRCASWIYTTGLSPADTAAALKAIEIIATEPQLRDRFWQNVTLLQAALCRTVARSAPNSLAIANYLYRITRRSHRAANGEKLQQAGIFAPAIRPPTVPTSRIRLSLMATHQSVALKTIG